MALLASDPGAGNIALWICIIILVVGSIVLWVVTQRMLRGPGDEGRGTTPSPPRGPESG